MRDGTLPDALGPSRVLSTPFICGKHSFGPDFILQCNIKRRPEAARPEMACDVNYAIGSRGVACKTLARPFKAARKSLVCMHTILLTLYCLKYWDIDIDIGFDLAAMQSLGMHLHALLKTGLHQKCAATHPLRFSSVFYH